MTQAYALMSLYAPAGWHRGDSLIKDRCGVHYLSGRQAGANSMAPAPPPSGVTQAKQWLEGLAKEFSGAGVLAQAGLRALDERLESPADLANWAARKLGLAQSAEQCQKQLVLQKSGTLADEFRLYQA